ncbi:MAG: PRC-barrel domain-containing protein [Nanoarchaeota archaeon]|nr:PRC-barrel domain-containing protein [Nanoarchaeota archaeon]
MLQLRRITEVYEAKVFTDSGDYFGDIEEAIITGNRVFGWRVRATRNSSLSRALGGARGVVVPHQLVRAIGDIMIISKAAIPTSAAEPMTPAPTEEY